MEREGSTGRRRERPENDLCREVVVVRATGTGPFEAAPEKRRSRNSCNAVALLAAQEGDRLPDPLDVDSERRLAVAGTEVVQPPQNGPVRKQVVLREVQRPALHRRTELETTEETTDITIMNTHKDSRHC